MKNKYPKSILFEHILKFSEYDAVLYKHFFDLGTGIKLTISDEELEKIDIGKPWWRTKAALWWNKHITEIAIYKLVELDWLAENDKLG